jgi:CHASE1-domain containing sensor protein
MYAGRLKAEDGAKSARRDAAAPPRKAGDWDHAVVQYFEPAKDEAAWTGLDLGSVAGLRDAMEYSCATDLPTLTPPLLLSRGCEDSSCVALCLPVYARNAPPLYVVEDRRRATTGWVIATLDVDRLLNDVIGKFTQRINLGVYDGTGLIPEHLLSRPSPRPHFRPRHGSIRRR